MFTFAHASNECKDLTKDVKEEKLTEKVIFSETDPLKKVTCSIWVGASTSGPGHWLTSTYSCFFCWGGAMNQCIAALAIKEGLVM